jgi:hypothetical protein
MSYRLNFESCLAESMTRYQVLFISQIQNVVVRNVCSTLANFSGYCCINPSPAPLICTSQELGIFDVIIKELATGTSISSVPVITKAGTDIFESWLQTPLQSVESLACILQQNVND